MRLSGTAAFAPRNNLLSFTVLSDLPVDYITVTFNGLMGLAGHDERMPLWQKRYLVNGTKLAVTGVHVLNPNVREHREFTLSYEAEALVQAPFRVKSETYENKVIKV